MTPQEILAIGRVIERLMICAIAGMSLSYGWNLFRVGVVNQQSAELSVKDWRVNLKRVGPGVFFALFGCVVLGLSLRSPLTLGRDGSASLLNVSGSTDSASSRIAAEQQEGYSNYAEGGDPKVIERWVASLNTILLMATPSKFAGTAQQGAVSRAESDLEVLRNTLVIRQFGPTLFREYKDYRQKHADETTQAERDRFAQIDEWMQGNRIQE